MQYYSLIIGIATVIITTLSYFKQQSGMRFFNGSYRNLIIKEVLTTAFKRNIWSAINKSIGLLDGREIIYAFLFFGIEISLILAGLLYVFFFAVVALPIIVVFYNLKLTRKQDFDLLNLVFKKEDLNKKEKRQLRIYGFLTYLFIINIIFFLIIAFFGNNSFKIIGLYLFSIAILLIVPEFAAIFIMQYYLRFDYDKVITKLFEFYKVEMEVWVSANWSVPLHFEGVAQTLYPHIKLDIADGKRMLIKWKDANILSFSVSDNKEVNHSKENR